MSVQATSWVWEHSKSSGTARLVLLAIADAANREGKKSYQSAATIAAMTGVSARSVWRAISGLEALGELRRSGIHGGHGTTVWELPAMTDRHISEDDSSANMSHDNMARRDIQGKSGVTKTRSGVTPVGTRPQRPQKETPVKTKALAKPDAPKEPWDQIAKKAYDGTSGALKYVAVRAVSKWAIEKKQAPEDQVLIAVAALYEMGKPITNTTVGQFLDGHIKSGQPHTTSDRMKSTLDIGRRLQAERNAS